MSEQLNTDEQLKLLAEFQKNLRLVSELIVIEDEVYNNLVNRSIIKEMDLKQSPLLKKHSIKKSN